MTTSGARKLVEPPEFLGVQEGDKLRQYPRVPADLSRLGHRASYRSGCGRTGSACVPATGRVAGPATDSAATISSAFSALTYVPSDSISRG